MPIRLKRAYDDPSPGDGLRVLVDGLWPRGVSKDEARIDDWMKDIAPSDDLRKWFGHDPDRWGEFRRRYLAQLKTHRETLRELAERSRHGPVTLVYAAKDDEHNNAVVVKQYLEMLGGE
jgi:uncharacterized protein YeaO (DUF488 family)